MFATTDSAVRRLVLERNYLWVYPLVFETGPVHQVREAEEAVKLLLIFKSVYVPLALVAAIRERLKEMGKGDEIYR